MAKTIADFEDFVFQYVADAPTPIIHHALRTSIVNFMLETEVARDYAQFTLENKVPDYTLLIPECRVMVNTHSVKYGACGSIPDHTWLELRRGEDYNLDILHDGYPALVLSEAPEFGCDEAGVDISVEYSWSISHDDCDVPDFIYDRYMQEIVDGALAILFSTPGEDWTNLAYATKLRSEVFERYKVIKSRTKRRQPQPMKMQLARPTRSGFHRGGSFWRA